MATVDELTIRIAADTKALQKALKDATGEADKTGSKMGKAFDGVKKSVFSLQGAVAGLGVAAAFKSIAKASAEQEKAIAQMEAALLSTKGAAGVTSEELQSMASSLQQVSTFGDEAVLKMQSVLLTFTKVGKETFPQATEAVLDMATRLGTDLNSAAIMVGKALNDPITGISAMSRAGIQFSEDQKEVIKALSETGRVAEAQAIILKELETQFGGSARAARQTFGGAVQSLGNAFGDLLEGDSMGGATAAINELTETLQSPEVKAGFASITSGIFTIIETLSKGAAEFAAFGRTIGEVLGEAVAGPIEKPANQAIALLNQQEEKVAGLVNTVEQYHTNLAALRVDPAATTEQVEAYAQIAIQQEAILARERERLDLVRGINQEAAAPVEAAAEAVPGAVPPEAAQPVDVTTKADAEREKQMAADRAKFEAMQEGFLTELETITLQEEQKKALLDEWRMTEVTTAQEHQAALTMVEEEAAAQRNALAESEAAAKRGIYADMFGNLASLMSSENKKLFEVGKVAAIANATLKGYEAVLNSYAAGTKIGGPAVGAAFAATAAIATAQQISQIASTSFSGGGSISAAGVSTTTTEGTAVTDTPPALEDTLGATADAGQAIVLDFRNLDPDSLVTVGNLAEMINEGTDRGVRIEVSG